MAGKERESIFGSVDEPETDDIGDLSEFGTKPRPAESSELRHAIQGLAKSSGFKSREPQVVPPSNARHLTGRNAQINLKAKPETIDQFNSIAYDHDWSKALTFERAVSALRRALAEGIDPKTLDG